MSGLLVTQQGADLTLLDPATGRRAGGCSAGLPRRGGEAAGAEVTVDTYLVRHGGDPFVVGRRRSASIGGRAPRPGESRVHTETMGVRLEVRGGPTRARCAATPAAIPDADEGPGYRIAEGRLPSGEAIWVGGREGAAPIELGRGDAASHGAMRTLDGHHAVLVRRAADGTVAGAELWNLDTGARVGSLPALGAPFAHGAVFAVVEGVVIVAAPNAAVAAWDLAGPRERWRHALPSRDRPVARPDAIPAPPPSMPGPGGPL